MFRFPSMYPIESPAVQFVVDQTHQSPVHPVSPPLSRSMKGNSSTNHQHVYSNGHVRMICVTRPSLFIGEYADMCLHPWNRLVPCFECCICMCYTAEYASVMQGRLLTCLARPC